MTLPGPARIVFGLALLVPLLVAGWFAGHRMLADIANQQALFH
jgi:hypothetical protein